MPGAARTDLRAAHPMPEGAGIGGMTCYGTLLSAIITTTG